MANNVAIGFAQGLLKRYFILVYQYLKKQLDGRNVSNLSSSYQYINKSVFKLGSYTYN